MALVTPGDVAGRLEEIRQAVYTLHEQIKLNRPALDSRMPAFRPLWNQWKDQFIFWYANHTGWLDLHAQTMAAADPWAYRFNQWRATYAALLPSSPPLAPVLSAPASVVTQRDTFDDFFDAIGRAGTDIARSAGSVARTTGTGINILVYVAVALGGTWLVLKAWPELSKAFGKARR